MNNPGCWARKLGDCVEKMTGDHYVSVVAFPGADRDERLKVPIVHMAGIVREGGRHDTNVEHGFRRDITVNTMKAKVLCKEHNTSPLLFPVERESGVFARAIDAFWDTLKNKRSIPGLTYAPKFFDVDGPLIERWFMKSLFTQVVRLDVPVGAPDAAPGTPTDELVDIVYGHRQPSGFMGLWAAAALKEPKDPAMKWFGFVPWSRSHKDDPSRRYIAGCLADFMGFRFAVNLERDTPVPVEWLRTVPGWKGIQVESLGGIHVEGSNVSLRFNWPAGRQRS